MAVPSIILIRDKNNPLENSVEHSFTQIATQIKPGLENVFFFIAHIKEPKLRMILGSLRINEKMSPAIGFIIPIEKRGDQEVITPYRDTAIDKITAESLSNFIGKTLHHKYIMETNQDMIYSRHKNKAGP